MSCSGGGSKTDAMAESHRVFQGMLGERDKEIEEKDKEIVGLRRKMAVQVAARPCMGPFVA